MLSFGFRKIIIISLLIKALIFVLSCASMVAPEGGPRDREPPVVLRSTPPNFSANFKEGRVRIYFDEYVELKDIRQKLIVSPPLETMPELQLRGKSVIMEFEEEELNPNTTYNFFFDDAIVDITEGNPILNFRFVFSTGDYLDSLSVKGNVLDAYTLKPEENVYVMLYDDVYDSVPYLQKPVYIAKANPEGDFEINYMRPGEYKIFALQDINANYLFDLPDEKIAFLDSLISPEYIIPYSVSMDVTEEEAEEPYDDFPGDTSHDEEVEIDEETELISIAEDQTIELDSLEIPLPEYEFYQLYLFMEEDTVQRVTSASMIRENVMNLAFRRGTENLSFRDLKEPFDEEMYFSEMNLGKDSLVLWLTEVERDSLFLEITDRGVVVDTAEVALEFRERAARGRAAAQDVVRQITFSNNLAPGRILPYFEQLQIKTDNPIKSFDQNCVSFFANDTVPEEVSFDIIGEANRTFLMKEKLEQDTHYKLKILDSCITDVFNLSHDTLLLTFRTDTEEAYGKMILNIKLPKEDMQYILQVKKENSTIIREKVINISGSYEFVNLKPETYSYKIIEDANKDGRWTSGRYLKGIQPEKVFLFHDNVQLRANWIMETDWMPEVEPEKQEEESEDDEF